MRQQGLLALIRDFNTLSVANKLPVQVFHYSPNDRHTLFREPKFHHIGTPNDNGPRELLTVHPTYEINDAVKELEYRSPILGYITIENARNNAPRNTAGLE